MEKTKKAWAYVKEHKKEILIGIGVAVSGVALYKVCKTKPRITTSELAEPIVNLMNDVVDEVDHIEIHDFKVGDLTDVMKYSSGSTELWLEQVDINDIGKLGEEIVSKIPDIPENAKVWMLMNISE